MTACPLLTLRGDLPTRPGAHKEVISAINYAGNDYEIADEVDDNDMMIEDADLVSSNRQVFGLVSYLSNLVTIDPKKLPVQQLIQVQ